MKVNLIGKKGYSGFGVYTEGLKDALDQKVQLNFTEQHSILKPQFLNQLLLSSLLSDPDADVNHFATQDLMSGIFIPEETKVVVTVHDIFPYLQYSGKVYSFMAQRYVKNIERKADRVIAISEFTKEQIIENTEIRESKIDVVYQGVDLETFKPVEEAEKDYFLHVGSEIDRKNISSLIEIFEGIKSRGTGVKLIRVGEMSKKAEKKIESSDLKLGEDIEYRKNLSEAELVKLYSGAEKLLFPSHAEGFGRPMLESLACGTPVVAYNKRPMSEILPQEMMVQAGDQDAFVQKALSNTHINCREIAEGFTWEKTADEVKKVYEKA